LAAIPLLKGNPVTRMAAKTNDKNTGVHIINFFFILFSLSLLEQIKFQLSE